MCKVTFTLILCMYIRDCFCFFSTLHVTIFEFNIFLFFFHSVWSLLSVSDKYTKLNLIVVLGTCVVLSFFAVDAVYTENEFQLFAFFALSAILFARVVWGYFNPNHGQRDALVQTRTYSPLPTNLIHIYQITRYDSQCSWSA
jgi:hypothetical protein